MAERLVAARLAAGLTQVEAARALNVAPPQLSKWETGRNVPGTESLRRLASVYGVTVPDLTGDAPAPLYGPQSAMEFVEALRFGILETYRALPAALDLRAASLAEQAADCAVDMIQAGNLDQMTPGELEKFAAHTAHLRDTADALSIAARTLAARKLEETRTARGRLTGSAA